MATSHVFRLTMIIPESRIAAINTWIRNNIDPTGTDWVTGRLSATGQAPATHGAFSAVLKRGDVIKFLTRLAILAGLTVPGNPADYTPAQVKNWLAANKATITEETGIFFTISDNDGRQRRVFQLLADSGLKKIQ